MTPGSRRAAKLKPRTSSVADTNNQGELPTGLRLTKEEAVANVGGSSVSIDELLESNNLMVC
jgi:hypothetical protein